MALSNVEKQVERDYYTHSFNMRRMAEFEKMLESDTDNEVFHENVNKDGTIKLDESDKNFKQLFGQCVDNYVNFMVPPTRKPVGRSATTLETDSFLVRDGPYEETYSCCPPPIAMIIMSLFQIGCFVANAVANEAVAKLLFYDPFNRSECWRFLTYSLVHIGYGHLIVNLVVQLIIGIPLEMANRWWRVIAVYLAGVIAGSLINSIVHPTIYLAGASGGVYAIITAHLSTIIMNWRKMRFPKTRLVIFVVFITMDVASTIRNRYYRSAQNISYTAHLGGALAGLLVGIWILKIVEPTEKRKYLWWAAFVSYILLMGIAIMLHIFWTDHFFNTA